MGGDFIRKLNYEQKTACKGGSFYAIAMGVGILVSTLASLVSTIVGATRPVTESSYTNYGYRRTAIMRLSPIPSRSSISIIQ